MADFDENANYPTENPTISPDNEPSMYDKLRANPWFVWVARVVIAVIIILIIVFGVRWIHQRSQSSKGANNVPTAANQSPTSNKTTGVGSSKSSPSNSSSNSNSKSNSSSTSSGSAAGPSLKSGSGQQLSNTGPGDVIALFLGVSFIAASLHYGLNLRKER